MSRYPLGGKVTALASAPHLDRLRDLGASDAFDYHTTSPRDLGHFDVIIDPVSKNMRPYRRLLAPGGRMAAMAIGSPADLIYIQATRIHGSRRIRFVQNPPPTHCSPTSSPTSTTSPSPPSSTPSTPSTTSPTPTAPSNPKAASAKRVIQIP
jgi:hypothetical protein